MVLANRFPLAAKDGERRMDSAAAAAEAAISKKEQGVKLRSGSGRGLWRSNLNLAHVVRSPTLGQSCEKAFLLRFENHFSKCSHAYLKMSPWRNVSASHSPNLAGMFLH